MAKNDNVEGKLSAVEKLLVLGLIRDGLTQTHIADALGMHQTSLSRAFPKGLLTDVARLRGTKQLEKSDGQQTSK